ncbi:hypothetical protein CH373_17465 [Leptospira perolatii]|uniref:Tetratricopeptide repeat protein n=1 Tax=Leptospira perolatii TaxID=2023191 RepID=A0A2M9ZIF4_9LEPT|nr:hypothetical protein [Leptospira perolatii]PJZ68348.1 hypothetical protein CH360_16750 [Leptospira perolatii]PJZ71836.1 hypothetical protein CH373_17465 [Leptospira perolatii]
MKLNTFDKQEHVNGCLQVVCKFSSVLFLCFLSACTSLNAQAKSEFGWVGTPGNFQLNIGGRTVLDKEADFRNLPDGLDLLQKSQYVLLAGEYLLLNRDSNRFTDLLNTVNKDSELGFAEALLSYFRDLYFSKKEGGEKVLRNWTSQDPYMKELSDSVKIVLLNRKSSKKLNCSNKKPYYSLCRLLRVGGYLSDFDSKESDYGTEYTNLHRVLAPFSEETELKHVPFLEQYFPNISDHLSELGLPREAVHFEKISIVAQNLGGRMVAHSYEKLAYYYAVDGDLASAEKVLKYIIDRQGELAVTYKNSLYLKLGTLAYLQNENQKALEYFLNLDFLDWSSRILHPFLGEPISINSARDLVSVAVWKSKNSFKAVDALKSVSTPKNLTEDDLFTRLRIIQILSDDEPEVASRLAMDLSFLAQSKGWRRVEYSATLLHGFLQLKTNNLRKAIIEFTKAYGILKESDPVYKEEWIRLNGLFLAHRESHNIKGVKATLDQALRLQAAESVDDKVFEIKNYLPAAFGFKNLENTGIDFYNRHGYLHDLLSHLVNSELNNDGTDLDSPPEQGLHKVHARILMYKGLYPPGREPWKSHWSSIRAKEVIRVREESDPLKAADLRKPTYPILALFQKESRLFLFSKDSDSNSDMEVRELATDSTNSYTALAGIRAALETFRKKDKVQIYLNLPGLNAAEAIRKEYGNDIEVQLFQRFSKHHIGGTLKTIIGPACGDNFPNNRTESASQTVWKSFSAPFFDGIKLLPGKSALLIWNLNASVKSNEGIADYEWTCGGSTVSFKKLRKRFDIRNVPDRIVFTREALKSGNSYYHAKDFLYWARFWLSSGTSRVYHIDTWSPSDESDIMFLEKLSVEEGETPFGPKVLKILRNLE